MSRLTRIFSLALVLFAITAAPSAAHKLTTNDAESAAAAKFEEVIFDLAKPFGGFTPEEFGFGTHKRTDEHRVVIEILVVDWGAECETLDEMERCVPGVSTVCSVLMPVSIPASHKPPLKWKAVVERTYFNPSKKRGEQPLKNGCASGRLPIPKRISEDFKPLRKPDNAGERTRQPRR